MKILVGALALVCMSATAQVSGSVSIWGRNGSLSINVPAPVYVQPYHYPQVQVLPPVYVQPPPVYVAPPRYTHQNGRLCLQHPYHDQYGRLIGYEVSCH